MSSKGWMLVVVMGASLACGGIEGLVDDALKDVATKAIEGEGGDAPAAAEAAAEPAAAAPAAAGGGGNAAACQKYIEAYNAAPCMASAKMDAATICNPALDQMPCDVSKYFLCMAENTKCNGPIPDLAGTAGCGQPVCQ